jgi:hypothetical protein
MRRSRQKERPLLWPHLPSRPFRLVLASLLLLLLLPLHLSLPRSV